MNLIKIIKFLMGRTLYREIEKSENHQFQTVLVRKNSQKNRPC